MITRIREVRRARGMTLDEVAKACVPPTTPQTIGRLETGTRTVSVGWLNRIAEALRVDAADLIADRAEFGLEDDSVEPGHAIGERDGAILLDEEARVFEARPEHAIVTLLDKLGLVRRADDV